ncbi:MAG TPA: DMT family transporter [Anaerovoracaceae bacterium]|nr:DMT family transporter [Anaerovoracaceae bacterium]
MEKEIQSKASSNIAKAHVLAFITIFIWGTTYISTKMLLVEFTPTEIMFYRFILAFLVLFLIRPTRIPYKNRSEELLFAGAGLFGVVLYFTLQNTCLVYTLASNAGVLISVAPFFTAILSYFLLKGEPLHKNFFIGFGVSIIGITLISFNGNFILKLNPLGDILAISCAVAWAGYCILMKKISVLNYDVILCTRKIFFYGIILMIPLLPLFGFHWELERFTYLPNLLHMLFLGLGASALCFVTWNYAVGVLGAVRTSIYIYFNPIVTVVTSAVILHERITAVAFAGVVLILAGLYLSERKNLSNKSGSAEPDKLLKEMKNEDDRNEIGNQDS